MARALDEAGLAEVMGTLAGDDTVFVAPRRAAGGSGSPGSCASCSGSAERCAALAPRLSSWLYPSGMPNAIVVHELGGPEKLQFESVPEPTPAAGQARIRHTAIGLNFVDVYYRTGLYKAPSLPFMPGQEGAGVVEAVGPASPRWPSAIGSPTPGELGAYAEARVIPADRLVRLPAGIDDKVAAAMMLKGMTAEFLLLRCARVARGDTILFHAAAGGVGSIACQWANALGLRVIGTAGGPEKVALARQNGCDEVIDSKSEDFVARVKELTGGAGVRAVFDSVGKDTFSGSLDAWAARDAGAVRAVVGRGAAVRPVACWRPRGSLFVTRPACCTTSPRAKSWSSRPGGCSTWSGGARCGSTIGQTYALRDAARAHRDSKGGERPGRPSSCLEPPPRFR